ncbi:hypothetical protein [Pseudolabrys sp. FHR47]|uniref:hypothetical protein n=1 Tax=Pseudolabrys sp. FHR47 TaxID=2562284 RepID=UPI0010BE80A0|nr:hypothetical protein [Pseudolabrys sp. FHR47]
MGRVFGIVVGLAGVIGAVFTVMQYFSAQQQPDARAPSTSTPPPTIAIPAFPEIGPDRAVGTRVQMRSPSTAAHTVMTLMNFDVSNIRASLWALSNGRLVQINSRTIPFIESGGYSAADHIPTPFTIGKMVSCVQYRLNGHNVEMIDFYTNEGHTQQQLLFGTMTKFRASVVDVDGAKHLCSSMPSSAASLL